MPNVTSRVAVSILFAWHTAAADPAHSSRPPALSSWLSVSVQIAEAGRYGRKLRPAQCRQWAERLRQIRARKRAGYSARAGVRLDAARRRYTALYHRHCR